MPFANLTFRGPDLDRSQPVPPWIPADLLAILEQDNGFILHGGGLHVRGLCVEPAWHSLDAAVSGPDAFHRTYPCLSATDLPFAQDCVGDQFILREGRVHRLQAELGDLEALDLGLAGFFDAAAADPLKFLGLHPLLQFQNEGRTLLPGQLLSVYPPFCTVEARRGVSLRAVSAADRLSFLADFSQSINAQDDDA